MTLSLGDLILSTLLPVIIIVGLEVLILLEIRRRPRL